MFLDYYFRCLEIFSWKDCLEILLISGLLYYFSLWLKIDKQKPLLLSFYGYFLVFFTTYYLNLITINTLLIVFFPVTLIGFILIHQTTLQKNFIALHKIHTITNSLSEDWIDILMRVSLIALSNNKRFYCVIEHNDSLALTINTPITLTSQLTEETFNLFMHSSKFDPYKFLWINNQGTIKGINSYWEKNSVETWLAQEVQEQEELIQDTLFFSTKYDLFFLCSDPIKRTFTIIYNGSLHENITTSSTLIELKKYFNQKLSKQGNNYGNTYQQNKSFKQLHY